MAENFGRVSQALRSDNGFKSIVALLGAIVLLGTWVSWALLAHVTRYEISDSARLEVNGSPSPVQANAAGRLVNYGLVLGKDVRVGDVLAELDSDDERLALSEQRTHLATIEPQLAALHAQLESEANGEFAERRVLTLSTVGTAAQFREADSQASLAAAEAARTARLHAEGIVSDAEFQRVQAAAESKRAAADSVNAAISKLAPELRVREQERAVREKQILGDIARLEADSAISAAAIHRLDHNIERRRILAPVSGRLAECATLHPGAHISEGQQLGVILPRGQLQVVAEFEPSAALGKVRAGQSATLRLQGFPWAQYGVVSAQVSRVAADIRDGKIRVELAVNASPHSRIPIQHGLPGSVEVAVENLSPVALVLRSVGDAMGAH